MEIFIYTQSYAQNAPTTANEFPIGAFVNEKGDTAIYNSFKNTGMNTIVHFAGDTTKPYLTDYNVIASNHDYVGTGGIMHWIGYYSTGFYSKWETEQNQTDSQRVGVKHKYGQEATWRDTSCWSTLGVNAPVCSLVYGPHYRQAKSYRTWTHGCEYCVEYNARFCMALDYDTTMINQDLNVCIIKVVHRYAIIYSPNPNDFIVKDTILAQKTLKVKDFNKDGSFKTIAFDSTYKYSEVFNVQENEEKYNNNQQNSYPIYSDIDSDNGVQFWVDWLTSDTLCTLYIDYAEVYDNDGWNDYISNSERAKNRIINYAQNYSQWSNIKYWYGHDEPYSLDAYVPMRTVDSILRSATIAYPCLINSFYPYWDLMVNGEPHLATYVNTVNPAQLMIDYYPFSPLYNPFRWQDYESARSLFQLIHTVSPNFWFNPQSYGIKDSATNIWCRARRPSAPELKAMVKLLLAHGCKGIIFWNYDSYATTLCNVPGYFDCILDHNGNRTDLWYLIRDNLAPRLKGTLGNSLLKLNYTGNYLRLRKNIGTESESGIYSYIALIDPIASSDTLNFHCGLLNDSLDMNYNKYFLLTNLITNNQNQ
jgi:hypothetical protein